MKSRYWFAVGVPFWAFWVAGSESQAADPLVTFEVTTAGLSASSVMNAKGEAAAQAADPDAHLLSFRPPASLVGPASAAPIPSPVQTAATAPGATPVAPPSGPAPDTPLPLPDAPVPLGSEGAIPLPLPPLAPTVAQLFEGGENSLVAVAVGTAEGTRTAQGERTLAYYGHVDPGNQAWNQGTFSYQHGARSPAEADQKQLERLKQQTKELHQLAFEKGLTLTQEEFLNGIDLANQAPQAALDRGYILWLAEAKKMGLQGEEAILWARTRAFLDPDTGRWNAPGLGNSVQSITSDQARRQQAIATAIAARSQFADSPLPAPAIPEETKAKSVELKEDAIDVILYWDNAN